MSDWSELPEVAIEVVEDRSATARCDVGFLRLRRLSLRNRYADGVRSETYAYDLVDRTAMDAVAIVLVARGDGGPRICLRSAIRPPLAFRSGADGSAGAVQWEIPAGLIEPGEEGEAGALACAAREALEEVGATLAPSDFAFLGAPVTLSPGVLAERLSFVVADVDPAALGAPTEDGTPVEERAQIRFVALPDALAACAAGLIADIKTELAIRRLAERESAG
ncbi:MAG: NUDIX hydrolase [Sandaracinaceae bacterium]|nr:NUDIX hydrolase [Sandaracinaceae bacterium]